MKTTASNAYRQLPDFLQDKISSFYQGRLGGDWRGKHIMRGLAPGKDSIILTSNDYLSLSSHEEVILSQREALQTNQHNPIMSAVFLHGDNPQSTTEQRFARHFNAPEAILCQSGYAANLGLLHTLVENTDVPVYFDMMAHMSLWDGAKLGGARIIPFLHNSVEHFASKLKHHGPGILVVDSVFSTDGSVCPLTEMVNTAHSAGCLIIVDESHSFGTHGRQGKGLVEELGLADKVMFRTASLAKAFAGRAGLILCPKGFSDMFGMSSKPLIFSSALMSADLAGLNKVLDLISSPLGEQRRERLRNSSDFLRQELLSLGFDVSESKSQIIGLKAGSEWETIKMRDALESRGVFGSPFCAPATSKKQALIRFSLNSELTQDNLEQVCDACRSISL